MTREGKAMRISDELRQFIDDGELFPNQNDELRCIADRIDNEMVELPKDRDGVPIHEGDKMYLDDGRMFVVTFIKFVDNDNPFFYLTDVNRAAYMPAELTHLDDGHVDRPGGKRGFQMTLQRLIGTSNPTRPALYARLADLIDTTSTVELKRVVFDEHCRTRWLPTCSACGSPLDGEVPRFCPNCGARLVSDSHESGSCASSSASLIDEDRRLYDIQIDLADEDAMKAIGSILGRKTGGDAHGHRSAD